MVEMKECMRRCSVICCLLCFAVACRSEVVQASLLSSDVFRVSISGTANSSYNIFGASNVVAPFPWRLVTSGVPSQTVFDLPALGRSGFFVIGRQFEISGTNLVIGVSGGVLASAGWKTNIVGGTVRLLPSRTNYVMLDLYDGTFHSWQRNMDRGSICLGSVLTSSNAVVSINPAASVAVPSTRIPNTRAKLAAGQPVRVLLLGDSLTQGAGSTGGSNWFNLLFSKSFVGQAVSFGKANITVINTGLGAVPARWGLVCIGDVVGGEPASAKVPVDAPQFGLSRGEYRNTNASDNLSSIGGSKWLTVQPDLVIVCFGANGGIGSQEELGYLETIVHNLRKRGIEVILWNGYFCTTLDFLNTEFDKYRAIADWQGCEFVDTFSRIAELNTDANGEFTGATYLDAIHQVNQGHLATAAAMKSLFAVPQIPEVAAVPTTRLLLNVRSNYFPNKAEIQLGTLGAALPITNGIGGGVGPAVMMGGIDYSNAGLVLSSNQPAQYSFSRALAVDIACWSTTNSTIDVSSGGDIVAKNVYVSSRSWGQLAPIVNMSQVKGFGGGWWSGSEWSQYVPNFGFSVVLTSGSLNIEGSVAYGFDGSVVPWSAITFVGVFSIEESAHDPGGHWRFSDDVGNASVVIPFTGNGLQVLLHAGRAGGIIRCQVDGQIVITKDLFKDTPIGGIYNLQLWPGNLDGIGKLSENYGLHSAIIKLVGINSSAGLNGSGDRRLGIYEAYAVDAR